MNRLLPILLSPVFAVSLDAMEINFEDHVLPIMEAHCVQCHNPDKAKGGTDVSSLSGILDGGSSGDLVVAGDPEDSTLYLVTAHLDTPRMPKGADKLSEADIKLLGDWIEQGLRERAGGAVRKAASRTVLPLLTDEAMNKPAGEPAMPADLLLEPQIVTARANAVTAMAASPWAPLVAVGGEQQVLLYHADSRELLGILPFPEGNLRELRFSPNGEYLIAAGGQGGKSGAVVAFKVRDGERVVEWTKFYDEVLTADLSADLRYLVAGGTDKTVKIYDNTRGEVVHNITKHTDWVTRVAFSPDGVLLATADRVGGLHVWEVESGQHFYRLPDHEKHITGLSWRRDSNVLLSGSEDETLRLWQLSNGRQIKSWKPHDSPVLYAGFNRDGRILSTGRNKEVGVWDQNGKKITVLKNFDDLPLTAAITSGDGQVVVGTWKGSLGAYSLEEKNLLGEFDLLPLPLIEQQQTAQALLKSLELQWKKDHAIYASRETTRQVLEREKEALAEREPVLLARVAEQEGFLEKLEGELLSMRSLSGEAESTISQLQDALHLLTAEQVATNRVTEHQQKIDEVHQQLDTAKANLADRINRAGEKELDVERTRKEVQSARRNLREWREALSTKRKALEAAEAAVTAVIRHAHQPVELVRAGREAKRIEAAIFNLDVHQARQLQQAHLAEVRATEFEVARAQESLKELKAEQNVHQSRLDEMQRRYRELKQSAGDSVQQVEE